MITNFEATSSVIFEEMGDFVPCSNWAEFKDVMSEMGEDFSTKKLAKDLFGDAAGIGCTVPFLVHTFHFLEPNSQTATDFQWTCSADTGWI